MIAREIRKLTSEEQQEELENQYREYFALRLQKAMDNLPQMHLIAQAKRNIARIKTVMNESRREQAD